MSDKAKITDTDAKTFQDGLENLIAQLGTEADKRHNAKFVNNRQLSAEGNQDELSAMYRADWLAGKVVDIIPDDMTREWRSFISDITPETVKVLEEEERRIKLVANFNTAHKWARLYGTSFIILSVDDGLEPDQPLIVENIKEGGLRHIKAIDRHRISTADVQPISDPMDVNFGMPEFYRFNETSVRIHHSRVLRFDGVQLPYDEFRRNNYNSDSVLDRLYEALLNLNTAADSAASMIYETNVDIVQVKGLMNYLQTPEGEAMLRKRFALATSMKSFNNMLLLDSDETFNTKTNTFSGLPDLLEKYAIFMSAASDIPATRLLGKSAEGLSATGEGDLRNYYDSVRSDQYSIYKPKLDYFDKIMAKSLGLDHSDLQYKFNSLFQVTPGEQATIDLNNAQRDAIYLEKGVVTEDIVAKELKQNSTYTNITDDYIDDLEEYVSEEKLNGLFENREETIIGNESGAQEGEEEEDESDESAEDT